MRLKEVLEEGTSGKCDVYYKGQHLGVFQGNTLDEILENTSAFGVRAVLHKKGIDDVDPSTIKVKPHNAPVENTFSL
jgi:hypothetical protein